MLITSLILIPHYTVMFKEAENDLVIFCIIYFQILFEYVECIWDQLS